MDQNVQKKAKKYFSLNYTYIEICHLLKKKHNYKLSVRTLKRFFKANGLKRRNIQESPLKSIIGAILIELSDCGYNLGYRSMRSKLKKEYGLVVKEKTVLRLLRVLDPEGVAARKIHRLKRRTYNVAGPNFLWHADGNDKLNRYGFCIHGCVDGFSKKIMWLEVAQSNKDPKIVAYFYLKTVENLGYLPTLLRTDLGTENCIMGNLQQCLRYNHDDDYAKENSFITGKSTANQRVECSWNIFRRQLLNFYMLLFHDMEEDGVLNIGNQFHIDCLRYCFGPSIQHNLNIHKKSWNEHRIRKQNPRNLCSAIPNILYHWPERYSKIECKKPVIQECLPILKAKYTSKPQLYSQQFDEILKIIFANNIPLPPGTAEESLNLYLQIMKAMEDDFDLPVL